MTTRAVDERGRTPWAWLAPNLSLLGAMAVWGVARYPNLPDRVPQHVGPEGVDAWTDRSVGSAFLPVFVFAGLTVIFVACAAGAARVTPLDALPEPSDAWGRAAAATRGRPATAASARRLARALLMANIGFGVALLPLCWLQWRGTATTDVPGWILPVTLGVFLASLTPLALAWWRDARQRPTT
ncbi:DUF1648 domain-containing protein [Streptomyces sp. B6B3]|uniref:DUF1648 domain-containing protein n=1 Tax=Streptomyces sp. B6B3 TaxID=3153570 RepID=UPI00325EE2F3